ncbi:hypothetical protein T492DRAFT_1142688 [Pavlovales sp. CCMP2436]|nr:hypothetical protein T492DRAFT_1142688 [Pavlovales sp. CCMP2436]
MLGANPMHRPDTISAQLLYELGASLERWQWRLEEMESRLAAVENTEVHPLTPPLSPPPKPTPATQVDSTARSTATGGSALRQCTRYTARAQLHSHSSEYAHAAIPPYCGIASSAALSDRAGREHARQQAPMPTAFEELRPAQPAAHGLLSSAASDPRRTPAPRPAPSASNAQRPTTAPSTPITRTILNSRAPLAGSAGPAHSRIPRPRSTARADPDAAHSTYVVPEGLTTSGAAAAARRAVVGSGNRGGKASASSNTPGGGAAALSWRGPRTHQFTLSTSEFRELNELRAGQIEAHSSARRTPSPPPGEQRGMKLPSLMLNDAELSLVDTWRALHHTAESTQRLASGAYTPLHPAFAGSGGSPGAGPRIRQPSELAAIFQQLDTNHDGRIEFREFSRLLGEQQQLVSQLQGQAREQLQAHSRVQPLAGTDAERALASAHAAAAEASLDSGGYYTSRV